MEADVIVPVPLHRQRARERGFNQVDIFGRQLARRLYLPYRPVLLVEIASATGETFASLRRKVGSCTWRFCNARRRPS
jgi:competence protein ComFC